MSGGVRYNCLVCLAPLTRDTPCQDCAAYKAAYARDFNRLLWEDSVSPETKEKMRERLLWERFNGTPAYDCDGNCGAASDATCRAATPWGHMQAAGFGAPLPPGAKPAPVATSGVSLEELTAHLIAHPKQAYSDVAALLLKTYAINRR